MANEGEWENWPYKATSCNVSKEFSKDYGEIWTLVVGTAGQSEHWKQGTPDLCHALAWIVNQLHLGNCDVAGEEDGEIVSVLIGRGTPFVFGVEDKTGEEVVDEAKKHLYKRSRAVNIAGLFAQARERGVKPKYGAQAETVRQVAGADRSGHFNTELHYAFQLIHILKRIRERSFVLDSPPILGRASTRVVDLLGEATRCHLYGLHQASVAICRACLEKSLAERVPREQVLQERLNSGSGELECLIGAAFRLGCLDGPRHEMADQIRKHGNDVLHRGHVRGERSWDILLNTRAVVSYLFRDPDEAIP